MFIGIVLFYLFVFQIPTASSIKAIQAKIFASPDLHKSSQTNKLCTQQTTTLHKRVERCHRCWIQGQQYFYWTLTKEPVILISYHLSTFTTNKFGVSFAAFIPSVRMLSWDFRKSYIKLYLVSIKVLGWQSTVLKLSSILVESFSWFPSLRSSIIKIYFPDALRPNV